MYCKHCGKQIIDASLYCCFCGCKQYSIKSYNDSNDTNDKLPIAIEEEQLEEHLQKDEKTNTISNWSYLGRRLIGTIIDKIAILVICFIAILVIAVFDFDFFGELGVYSALFHMTTESVHSSAIGHVMANYPGDYMSQHQLEIDEYFSYLLSIELKITSLFVLINIIYYFLLESALGVSVGKYLFRLKLINSSGNTYQKISIFKVTTRAIVLFVMASLIISLRWLLGFNYYIAIVLFFLVLDFPVLFWNKSLIDMVTSTKLVYEPISCSYSNNINNKRVMDEKQESNMLYERHKTTIGRNAKRIGWCCLLIISLYSVHTILSYFFADYYNPSNYDITNNVYNEKESDNYLRKVYEKGSQSWNEFPTEKFAISRQLSHTNTEGKWGNPKYGPIPNGKLISTYEGSGTDTYLAGYKTVKRFRWENVIPRSHEEAYEWMRTGEYKIKKVYYTTEEPNYKTYSYRNSISTYAISGLASVFANCEWLYKSYLDDIAQQLNANHISFSYIKVDGKNAISYISKDLGVERVIVYANGNAYLLETEATAKQSEQSEKLCSSVSLNHFQIVGGKRKIVTLYCILFLCVTIVIAYYPHRKLKDETCNRYAYSLFCVGIGSVVVSLVIAMCQSYMLYTHLFASCSSFFVLAGTLITTTFIATPLCVFYYLKSKDKWRCDYIVPPLLKRFHYDTIKSEVKKKLYISFVCYPLMVLSLLPLGIFVVLFYSVPLLLICTITIWFNKWKNWVKGSKISEEVSSNN